MYRYFLLTMYAAAGFTVGLPALVEAYETSLPGPHRANSVGRDHYVLGPYCTF